ATVAVNSAGTLPTNAVAVKVTRPRARNAYHARSRLDKVDPPRAHGIDDGRHAHPDHVGAAAADARHQSRASTLDGVPSGLVEPFPGGDVAFDLAVREGAEGDFRADGERASALAPGQSVPGEHLVRPARQAAQEGAVVVGIERLGEHHP